MGGVFFEGSAVSPAERHGRRPSFSAGYANVPEAALALLKQTDARLENSHTRERAAIAWCAGMPSLYGDGFELRGPSRALEFVAAYQLGGLLGGGLDAPPNLAAAQWLRLVHWAVTTRLAPHRCLPRGPF